jgi:hypothetical protein
MGGAAACLVVSIPRLLHTNACVSSAGYRVHFEVATGDTALHLTPAVWHDHVNSSIATGCGS